MTGTHEQSRLREPAHRTAEVRAVDGEDLKALALHAPHPAWNLVGFAIPCIADGVRVLGQARLALGEFVEFAQGDPLAITVVSAAQDWPQQIADNGGGEHGHRRAVEENADLDEKISPGGAVLGARYSLPRCALLAHCCPPEVSGMDATPLAAVSRPGLLGPGSDPCPVQGFEPTLDSARFGTTEVVP